MERGKRWHVLASGDESVLSPHFSDLLALINDKWVSFREDTPTTARIGVYLFSGVMFLIR